MRRSASGFRAVRPARRRIRWGSRCWNSSASATPARRCRSSPPTSATPPSSGRARAQMDFPVGCVPARAHPPPKPPAEERGATNIQNEANRLVLTRYSPPGVLVDDDLKIVQFRGQTGVFLEPAPGEASLDLLK